MITINATGDTTLHTAGKYCPEDILVKVPAGGSGGGGASLETCTVTINPVADMMLSPVPPNYTGIVCTVYREGVITSHVDIVTRSTSTTISDVVRGSALSFYCYGLQRTVTVGAEQITCSDKTYFFRIDDNAEITIS